MPAAIVCPSGIYAITNTVNGKRYVGSAANLKARWRVHKARLTNNEHHSSKLQNSWLKNGAQSFLFEVIEYVEDRAALLLREQHWIDFFGASSAHGYNISPTAGSPLGVRHSAETKAKKSAKLKGRKRSEAAMRSVAMGLSARTDAQKAESISKRSAALLARTPEQKAESAAKAVETKRARGNLKSRPEAIAKQRAAITGRTLSRATIEKRSATVRANALARRESGETRKYVRK